MRYTEGEWLFDPNESEFSDKHYIFCPAGKTICSIFGPHDDPEDEANGNAYLIAAAPDLLEALRRSTALFEWESKYVMGGNMSDHERAIIIQLSKAAIKKATGEQS